MTTMTNYADGDDNDENDDGGVYGNCAMTTMVMNKMTLTATVLLMVMTTAMMINYADDNDDDGTNDDGGDDANDTYDDADIDADNDADDDGGGNSNDNDGYDGYDDDNDDDNENDNDKCCFSWRIVQEWQLLCSNCCNHTRIILSGYRILPWPLVRRTPPETHRVRRVRVEPVGSLQMKESEAPMSMAPIDEAPIDEAPMSEAPMSIHQDRKSRGPLVRRLFLTPEYKMACWATMKNNQ